MTGPATQDADQAALLFRLHRLQVQAKAAGLGDRAALIALIDDIEKVRCELLRQASRTDDELRRAAMRTAAITAYAHGARAIGRARRH